MQEKSQIKRNILQFIDYKGITKSRFYGETGITRGVLDQNNGLSEENLTRFLATYPEVNINWLILTQGEMFKNLEEKYQARELSSRPGNKTPNSSTNMKTNSTHVIYDDPEKNPGSVPFYESDAYGGPVPVFDDSPEFPTTRIYFPGFEDCSFALRASGDSMEEHIHAGDIIVCKEIQNKNIISYGDMYLIITNEHRLIKTVRRGFEKGRVILRSYNENYDDIDISIDDINRIYLIKGVIKKTQL